MVRILAAHTAGYNISVVTQPPGHIKELACKAVTVALFVFKHKQRTFFCPVRSASCLMRTGKICAVISNIQICSTQLLRLCHTGICALGQRLIHITVQNCAARGITAICAKSEMPYRTVRQIRTVRHNIIHATIDLLQALGILVNSIAILRDMVKLTINGCKASRIAVKGTACHRYMTQHTIHYCKASGVAVNGAALF